MPPVQSVPLRPLTLQALAGPIMGAFSASGERNWTIGRAAASDMCLVNEGVSRRHATLVPRAGVWYILDHASTAGTYVNGVRLAEGRATPVASGDLLRIGPCIFRVTLQDDRTGPLATLIDAPGAGQRVERSGPGPGSVGAAGVSGVGTSVVGRADRRLKLLGECIGRLSRASEEQPLARIALEAALSGSGFRHGAILRQLRTDSGAAGELEVVATMPEGTASTAYSRSLVRQASAGELVVLTEERAIDYGQSIAEMRIQSALCAPVHLGDAVEGFLYLDARAGVGSDPAGSAGASGEVAGFCDAVAKAYGLAIANVKRAELQRRQNHLQVDLDAAREAQNLILPPTSGAHGALRYAARTVPGQFVAGDLFNILDLHDGRIAVCLGDVAGHGVASAIVMSALQAHLHAQLEATDDPAKAVTSVNRYLAERAAAGRFASLWVGVFRPDGTLQFVDAGHGHWLVHAGGGAPVHASTLLGGAAGGRGIPVGIMPEAQFTSGSMRLGAGDRLYLYSDGIVEQRSPDGKPFGLERLLATAGGLAPRGPLPEAVAGVFGAVTAFAGFGATSSFDDDTSAAVIEWG